MSDHLIDPSHGSTLDLKCEESFHGFTSLMAYFSSIAIDQTSDTCSTGMTRVEKADIIVAAFKKNGNRYPLSF